MYAYSAFRDRINWLKCSRIDKEKYGKTHFNEKSVLGKMFETNNMLVKKHL